MEVLAHRWGHALHLSVVQGNVPGVVFTWLRRLECTRMLQRFRSFLKATRGLSQKVVTTVALSSRICQLDRRIRQTGRLWGW